tara:strand:+ start:6760 stop:8637 length:1878 start_codon:yes stop_codon:yes gene_type:complete
MKEETLTDLSSYLSKRDNLSLLRILTCGSVDDGKSTLIGRLLYESKSLLDSQIANLELDSRKHGTQGEDIDFALLVDGLSAEREQGITIDVAYRYFFTDKRKFVIADCPGHEQYTRNMVTGATVSDLAIILVDAEKGIMEQTKRHAFLANILGIQHVVLAVNKMDISGFDKQVFQKICLEFEEFSSNFKELKVEKIPLSALKGENLVKPSKYMNWFKGPTLLGYLESVKVDKPETNPFRFPIQLVSRPNSKIRAYMGLISSGKVSVGDNVSIQSSEEVCKVKEILLGSENLDSATEGLSVALTLDREVDISRGELLSSIEDQPKYSDHFEVDIAWLGEEKGFKGRRYLFKNNNQHIGGSFSDIKYKYNINSFEEIRANSLEKNDIARVSLKLDQKIAYDEFVYLKDTGSLVVIDQFTNQTLAAAMIRYSLRRSENIYRQEIQINRQERESLNGHKSKILWFTGLSGSGKSTIANLLDKKLYDGGIRSYILDGDNLRLGLNRDLGFNEKDRIENIRRVSEVASLMLDAGIYVLCCFISPFAQEREQLKGKFDNDDFIEIYVKTTVDEAKKRDPKGLYAKAEKGLIPNFTGVNSPYEAPINPDIILDTGQKKPEELAEDLYKFINKD